MNLPHNSLDSIYAQSALAKRRYLTRVAVVTLLSHLYGARYDLHPDHNHRSNATASTSFRHHAAMVQIQPSNPHSA